MPEDETYYAHTPNAAGHWHRLDDHLREVARRAAGFAAPWGGDEEARLAGMLHDSGKASDLFAARLRGEVSGLDHWSPGAWLALTRYQAVRAALAIHGHHVGLQRGDAASLRHLAPVGLVAQHPLGLRPSEGDTDALARRMPVGALPVPNAAGQRREIESGVGPMLDTRMLFSALVDADFLDTERHFGGVRASGPDLQPERALEAVQRRAYELQRNGVGSPVVQALRSDLWAACLSAAEAAPGQFTLSAPTGAGKTLAMLGFALRHAALHGLRRIVVVVPYLSIIDQTARVLQGLFEPLFGPLYLIEHHSLAGLGAAAAAKGESDDVGEARRQQRLLAENWDAPVIVTTSVQMLESLFADRPAPCRKLHRLAQSVLLFDEVQTLPVKLAVPTLAALSHLSERYGTSVVFATATQPAFARLSAAVRQWGAPGWEPREIATHGEPLFGRVRRVSVHWPEQGERMTWPQVADRLCRHDQALCIVNLKRHARDLIEVLRQRGLPCVLHLSTSMCPNHRRRTLMWVRRLLARRQPCVLVATSCVEAGVDLDFPFGMRAFGDLASVAQAAGRVNRGGTRPVCDLVVFRPEVDGPLYPPGAYAQAANVAEAVLAARDASAAIDDPDLFDAFYSKLYTVAQPAGLAPDLYEAVARIDYPAARNAYRLIPQASVNVLVPYGRRLPLVESLSAEVRDRGLTADWIRRARPYTVSLFRPRAGDPALAFVHTVPVGRRGAMQDSNDWFIYWEEKHYDPFLGLLPPSGSDVVLA